MSRKTHHVIFQPMGVRADVPDGETLRAAARAAGVAIDSICGERATCGRCRVIVQRGDYPREGITSRPEHLSPPDADEQAYRARRRQGISARGEDPEAYRLSCRARVHGNLVVMVPESSRAVKQVVRKAARERTIEIRPMMRKLYVELEPPTLEAPRADWERMRAALAAVDPLTCGPDDLPLDIEHLTIDLPALRALQRAGREGNQRLTVTVRAGREVVRVEPGFEERLVGLAVDVGTTTIAMYLCNLRTGEVLATGSAINPQVGYGEDIISRMYYAQEHPEGLETLRTAIVESLNRLARHTAHEAGLQASEIIEMVIVGNTVMEHLLLGLETLALGRAPYVPALHDALDLRARDIGLTAVNEGATVHLLPIAASFVGADHMAVLLAEEPDTQDEHWLIVDVGTNAELVVGSRERLVCTSTPTGPAFEGAHIEYGMRAAEGAIERVVIDPQTLIPRFKVIGSEVWSDAAEGERPLARGICGSGIIDAVAEMYRVGLVRADGRLADDVASPNLRQGPNGPYFVLAEEWQTSIGQVIPITQEDVRQVQLAKAPLYVAAHYLLAEFGLERPDRILLAGGFGSHIDPVRAMLLGMIPDCPLDRVHAVGNSAGDGARIALLNRDRRAHARSLLRRIERIELPVQPGFQDQFMLALHLPHMIDPYPHLEGLAPPREINPMAQKLYGGSAPTLRRNRGQDKEL